MLYLFLTYTQPPGPLTRSLTLDPIRIWFKDLLVRINKKGWISNRHVILNLEEDKRRKENSDASTKKKRKKNQFIKQVLGTVLNLQ
jgi:hypothetical protein